MYGSRLSQLLLHLMVPPLFADFAGYLYDGCLGGFLRHVASPCDPINVHALLLLQFHGSSGWTCPPLQRSVGTPVPGPGFP